jgi:cobalt-zinc-cadmium resistance protein CzcA
MFPEEFDIDEQGTEDENAYDSVPSMDSINSSPLLGFYQKQVDISNASWKAERSNYLPKLNLGYVKQAVDGQSGFYSWQAGISIPLLFFSQSGKTKAARLNYEIAGQSYKQKQLELNATFNELYSRYQTMLEVLDYYNNEALPLADEQIEAANLGYKLGSLDYIQFIQNVELAIKTKQEYLFNLSDYYQIKEQLEYISGQ